VLKVFETEDIQQTDRACAVFELVSLKTFWLDGLVHLFDKPIEHVVIDLLCQRVDVVFADLKAVVSHSLLSSDHVHLIQKDLLELGCVTVAQESGNNLDTILILDLALLGGSDLVVPATRVELDLAHI